MLQVPSPNVLTLLKYFDLQIQLAYLLQSRSQISERVRAEGKEKKTTDISKVSVQDLHVAVNNLQRYEFVVARANPANEEQRSISPINDLCVCETAMR